MKYLKLGTKPDSFYTLEAIRSVQSEVPPDLIIHVNNTKYLLHKCSLLLKCGRIRSFCPNNDSENGEPIPIALHDIPGGEEALELCVKFCYGITINLSAHNFAAAIAAAKFLQMTEKVAKGNFITKLELFFQSCILEGWKDTIVALQSMWRQSGWSDDHRIVQTCLNLVIEKILIHPSQVTWSYTYTRPGYMKKKLKSAPKDWWTEDVSDLDLDLFQAIISTIRSTKKLPAALTGEALHVYACKHLPNPLEIQEQAQSSSVPSGDTLSNYRRVLEAIVSMIPTESGSVTGSFLFKLLKIANHVGASPSTKAELIRQCGHQLDEVTATDLIIPSATNPQTHDISTVEAVLECFLLQFHQPMPHEETERMIMSMSKVGIIYDSYLKIIARESSLTVSKFIELANALPEMARKEHDGLYQAIDVYLKEHPELSKADRKGLCKMINCQKLSPEARAHAIANDHLPLRTIVQLLFVEQEKKAGASSSKEAHVLSSLNEISQARVDKDEARRSRHGQGGHQQKEPALAAKVDKTRVVPSPTEPKIEERKERVKKTK